MPSGCVPYDWMIAAGVMVAFVTLGGLVWHIAAVVPQIGGMRGKEGGVFLGFMTLAAIAVVSVYISAPEAARNKDYELAAIFIWTIITAIFIFAMAFAWASWRKYAIKGTPISVAWPITHTIITAAAIATAIGVPITYAANCNMRF